jgi:hypothetical protein
MINNLSKATLNPMSQKISNALDVRPLPIACLFLNLK